MAHYVASNHMGEHRRRALLAAATAGAAIVLVFAILAGIGATISEIRVTSSVTAPRSTPRSESVARPVAGTLGPHSRRIGRSVRGRPIALVSFGSGAYRVLIVGGVHGNEYGTDIANELVTYLTAHPARLPVGTTLDVVPCANPDGRTAARRTNAHGVDINCNFPAGWSQSGARPGESAGAGPASEPETRAIIGLLAARHYARVIALHSTGALVDFDGPGGSALARRIGRAAGLRVVHLAALHSYKGSMGRYGPAKSRIPNITWELGGDSLRPRVLAGLLTAMRP